MERAGLIFAPEWLQALIDAPEVTDICLNGTKSVYYDQGSGMEELPLSGISGWTDESLKQWVLEQVSLAGKTWDARHPFIDSTLRSGHRLHVAFPPIARHGVLLSIRRLAAPRAGNEATGRWTNSSAFFAHLSEAVTKGESMLICGATGSGKTTLASDLLSCVAHSERIVALEDTPELAPAHPHFISLISRPANADGYGEVTLRTLLKQVLRMRPDRIVLGECRGSEVLDLLQALNTGHRGSLATLHANSPRDALRRVELLCLLAAAGAIPSSVIRELISIGIQWVAHVERDSTGRRISAVWRIEGREGDTILMRPMVNHK